MKRGASFAFAMLCSTYVGWAQTTAGPAAATPVDYLTRDYNNARTGNNAKETILTTTNVNQSTFGKLFTMPVDGHIYSAPLIVTGLNLGAQGVHNVAYVCTSHNSVYCYNADAASSTPYWKVNFGPSVPTSDYGPSLMTPEIGICSTPVIDRAANTIYVVAKTKENGTQYIRLHALNLTNGHEMANSPMVFQGSVPGTGAGSSGGNLVFNPYYHMNRPALLLAYGHLFVGFGSYADISPYHGWMFVVAQSNLHIEQIFCNTANGTQGGIWMSGHGPAADANGNVYFTSGNGSFTANSSGAMTGNSIVKARMVSGGTKFALQGFFTPHDSATMNSKDQDLGSSGPLLVPSPGQNVLIEAGKDGSLYQVDTNNMGFYNATTDKIAERFSAFPDDMDGGFVTWASPTYGQVVYGWASADFCKMFKFGSNGLLVPTPASQSTVKDATGFPGAMLAVSSNGNSAASAILWAQMPVSGNAAGSTVPGILRAFAANDLTKLLWSSEGNATRDRLGNFGKFQPPVVVNGKVYCPNFSNQVVVYGLLSGSP